MLYKPILNSIYIPTLSLYTTHSQFKLHSNPLPPHKPLSIQFKFQPSPSKKPTLTSIYIPTLSLYTIQSEFDLHSNSLHLHTPLSIQFTLQHSPSTEPTVNSIYIPTPSLYTIHFQFNLHSNPHPLHNLLYIQFRLKPSPSTQPTLYSIYIKTLSLYTTHSIQFTFQLSPSTQPTLKSPVPQFLFLCFNATSSNPFLLTTNISFSLNFVSFKTLQIHHSVSKSLYQTIRPLLSPSLVWCMLVLQLHVSNFNAAAEDCLTGFYPFTLHFSVVLFSLHTYFPHIFHPPQLVTKYISFHIYYNLSCIV